MYTSLSDRVDGCPWCFSGISKPNNSVAWPGYDALIDHLLVCLAGLHYILKKNIWEEAEKILRWLRPSSFHLFHQALSWLSCLRSPTTRHAVDFDRSWDFHRTSTFLFSWCILSPVDLPCCSSRQWYLETQWHASYARVRHLSTASQGSTVNSLFKLLCTFLAINYRNCPLVLSFRRLKGFTRDLRGTQAASSKKNIWRGCIFFLLTFALLHLLSTDLTTLLVWSFFYWLDYYCSFHLFFCRSVSLLVVLL